MSWKSEISQNWKGAGAGALLATMLGLGLLVLPLSLGQYLIQLSYNVPFRNRPIQVPQDLVLVYMDEVSHKDLGQPYDRPWNRALYGRLLNRFTTEHAKAVAFDIVFSNTNFDYLDGDRLFAQAIKDSGKVVLAAEYRVLQSGDITMPGPAEEFEDGYAGLGFVQLAPDQDFMVRVALHVPQDKGTDGVYLGDSYSSMAWELARVAGVPFATNLQERFFERWMNYYGPPGSLPNVNFETALETNNYCPANYFSNKVVLVGSSIKSVYSGERKDELRTPYAKNGFVFAVDVQATEFLNLYHHDWLTRPSKRTEILIVILAGLVFGFGLASFRPIIAVGLAVAGALLVTFGVQTVFDHYRIWFPWLIIIAVQIPVALFWSVIYNSVQLYVQNRLFEESLRMYLSPKLVKKFSSEKDILKPGAKKQLLTILFSDIAGFTTISEGMDSDELANLMNKYFESAVSDCIHATDGTIVKYIGDAIFAFWNAPDSQLDHCMQGCEAALRFRDQPTHYVNGHALVTRIGLHTGVANVGNFGSTARVDYTAIGENINLASRMEGLNKYLGTEVLITSDTQTGIKGRLITRFLGDFQLKGFEKTVGVYELAGQLAQAETTKAVHEAFAAALQIFKQKDFTGAEAAFRRVLEINPKDGPSKFYLKFIAELHENPLPDDWQGEIELKEK